MYRAAGTTVSQEERIELREAGGRAATLGEADLLAMVDGASDGLLVLSRAGQIVRANEAAAEMLNSARDRLIGRSIQEVLFRDHFESSFIAEAIVKGSTVNRACDLPDGRKFTISAWPVAKGAKPASAFVLVIRDVTGARQQVVNRLQAPARILGSRWVDMRRAQMQEPGLGEIVIKSERMQAIRDMAVQCAAVDSPVLLLGETGTGKGVFAALIHHASTRVVGPFQVVNCGSIPEGLLEAELFGYAKGAFTGADARGKIGLIDLAHIGTLVLDEIGDLPLGLQVKLLRFVETGEVWPIGASECRRPDVRIIAATNRDLRRMIADGTFRKDLFYRLSVLVINIPPLRQHPEDIPLLVGMMLEQLERRLGVQKRLTREAMDTICRHEFQGNVRQLWNLVESLVVTCKSPTIDVGDLPDDVAGGAALSPAAVLEQKGGNLRETLRRIEAQILKEALRRFGTQSKAARYLGVAQATIARKTKQYGLGA
jgi:PAS domain S-box-containing protein